MSHHDMLPDYSASIRQTVNYSVDELVFTTYKRTILADNEGLVGGLFHMSKDGHLPDAGGRNGDEC